MGLLSVQVTCLQSSPWLRNTPLALQQWRGLCIRTQPWERLCNSVLLHTTEPDGKSLRQQRILHLVRNHPSFKFSASAWDHPCGLLSYTRTPVQVSDFPWSLGCVACCRTTTSASSGRWTSAAF